MNTKSVLEVVDFGEEILKMDGISAESVKDHLTLYQGYIKKYNEIMQKLTELKDEDYAAGNQIYSTIRALKVDLTFAIGGVKNHEIYFAHLGGKGGKPEGALLEQIENDFGSFENWERDLKASGMGARGWVWLAWDNDYGYLFNYIGDAQNTFPVWNATPILALDVYEHAYFKDYGTARAKYIEAFLKNLDWDVVSANFESMLGEGCCDCCDEESCCGEGECCGECGCKNELEEIKK
ncbi:MAG: superoxide dismutase [Fe] [Patescibacteria group bacterium]|nr:MAG: superoxide dismutase [Fe] [Patescibacteria group bacterium]